jgi:hypothetical protein
MIINNLKFEKFVLCQINTVARPRQQIANENERRHKWLLKALKNQRMTKFIGLMTHFAYWNMFPNINGRASLPMSKKTELSTEVNATWSDLEGEYKRKYRPWGVGFALPVVVLTIKEMVYTNFLNQYPKLQTNQLAASLVCHRINIIFMRQFDMGCFYAKFAVFDATARTTYRQLALLESKKTLHDNRKAKQEQQETDEEPLMKKGGGLLSQRVSAQIKRVSPLVRQVLDPKSATDCFTRKVLHFQPQVTEEREFEDSARPVLLGMAFQRVSKSPRKQEKQ